MTTDTTNKEAGALSDELASMTRMFHEACAALGLIDEALGIDPDDAGGAAPILEAIAELKSQIAAQVQTVPALTADQIDEVIADLGCRNAAGGIYTGSVYEFARAIYALAAPAASGGEQES